MACVAFRLRHEGALLAAQMQLTEHPVPTQNQGTESMDPLDQVVSERKNDNNDLSTDGSVTDRFFLYFSFHVLSDVLWFSDPQEDPDYPERTDEAQNHFPAPLATAQRHVDPLFMPYGRLWSRNGEISIESSEDFKNVSKDCGCKRSE